ncbi:unnamed protein product [Prunus armeniaca]
MDFWLKDGIAPVSLTLSLPRASLPLSGFRDGWNTKVDGAGTKMTGHRPLPTPAGSHRQPPWFRRKTKRKAPVLTENSPASFSVVRPPFLAIKGSAGFRGEIPATSGQILGYVQEQK